VQSLSKFQWHSSQILKNQPKSSFGSTRDHEQSTQYWAKRATLKVSQYPTSNYSTEP
jgi:hypothetical protein